MQKSLIGYSKSEIEDMFLWTEIVQAAFPYGLVTFRPGGKTLFFKIWYGDTEQCFMDLEDFSKDVPKNQFLEIQLLISDFSSTTNRNPIVVCDTESPTLTLWRPPMV
jgi:hypothetical protein